MVAPTDNSTEKFSKSSLPLTGEGVVIDIGTGDGLFVYQSARQNPDKFYIGIDPNVTPLKKISEKIHRKKSKGGASNVLFVNASVEELPQELDGVADEVHIHFPWGTLLRAVAAGDINILQNIRRMCADDGVLEIVIGIDPDRDQAELNRLGLQSVTVQSIDEMLAARYREARFQIVERGELCAKEWPEFNTSWAKRLKGSENRPLIYLIARAV